MAPRWAAAYRMAATVARPNHRTLVAPKRSTFPMRPRVRRLRSRKTPMRATPAPTSRQVEALASVAPVEAGANTRARASVTGRTAS